MIEIILPSLITGIFAVTIALIANKNKNLKKQNLLLENDKNKIETELSAITILFNHSFINTLNDIVEEIFTHTKTTRFLLLFAVNGKETFKYVTACYESNKNPKYRVATKKYIRLKIDEQYKNMLKKVEHINKEILNTETMQPCLLKNIYESYDEQIKNGLVYFIDRIPIDDDNDALIYASISTTDDELYNSSELFLIDTNVNLVKNSSKIHLDVN